MVLISQIFILLCLKVFNMMNKFLPSIIAEGFISSSPTPTKEELEKYYKEEFYQSEKPNQINDSSKEIRDRDSIFYNLQYSIFSHILKLENSEAHADLGCGYGHFLQYISNIFPGKKYFGCEVYPEAGSYIESIKNATFIEFDLNNMDKCFDRLKDCTTYSLINTLEHLQDPKLFLEEIYTSMNVGNKLLLQVPNDFNPIQKSAVKELQLDEWWFCPPRHISYFSPLGLKNLCEEVGFKCEEMVTTFPIDMFLLCGLNYRTEPNLGRKAHVMRTLFEKNYINTHGLEGLLNLYKNFANANIGREIIIVLLK